MNREKGKGMAFKLQISTFNAAFDDGNAPEEVATRLERVAEELRGGATERPIRDTNGNKVGSWALIDDPD
jgi:hypothetical protein